MFKIMNTYRNWMKKVGSLRQFFTKKGVKIIKFINNNVKYSNDSLNKTINIIDQSAIHLFI